MSSECSIFLPPSLDLGINLKKVDLPSRHSTSQSHGWTRPSSHPAEVRGPKEKRGEWAQANKDFKSLPCTIAIGRHLMLESDHLIKQIDHFSSQGRTRKEVERTAKVSHSSPTASTSKKGIFLFEKQGFEKRKGSFTVWPTERNTSLTKLTGDQSRATTYYGELSMA